MQRIGAVQLFRSLLHFSLLQKHIPETIRRFCVAGLQLSLTTKLLFRPCPLRTGRINFPEFQVQAREIGPQRNSFHIFFLCF